MSKSVVVVDAPQEEASKKRKGTTVRIQKYICDGCQDARESKHVPEGWLEFNIMSGQQFAVPYEDQLHACSDKCAVKVASEAIKPFFQRCRCR